jgi:hypothetical protein
MNSKLIQGLTDELDIYWMELVKELRDSMIKQKIYASGVTASSIGEYNKNPTEVTAKGIKVTLGMPDHYIYLDRGVNGALSSSGALPTEDGKVFAYKKGGKIANIGAVKKFMQNRGITKLSDLKSTGTNTRSGRKRQADMTLDQVAFVIARSIWAKGTKPTKFYSNVVNDKQMLALENRLMAKFGNLIVDIVKI